MMPTRAFAALADEVARRNGRLIACRRPRPAPVHTTRAAPSPASATGSASRGLRRTAASGPSCSAPSPDVWPKAGRPQALALLAEHGRFTTYNDSRWARADLIDEWVEDFDCTRRRRALILAHDRREVAELNKLARAVLDDEGLLGEERAWPHTASEWADGDRLLCRRNDYRRESTSATEPARP